MSFRPTACNLRRCCSSRCLVATHRFCRSCDCCRSCRRLLPSIDSICVHVCHHRCRCIVLLCSVVSPTLNIESNKKTSFASAAQRKSRHECLSLRPAPDSKTSNHTTPCVTAAVDANHTALYGCAAAYVEENFRRSEVRRLDEVLPAIS